MEMTKQRKMLLVVAGLGVGGLLLDKFVLAGPEKASADIGAVAAAAAAPAPVAQADAREADANKDTPKALPSYATLTERLLATSNAGAPSTDKPSDPFALPTDWAPAERAPIQPRQTDTPGTKHPLLEQYKLDGTFRSVIDQQEVMFAVISGGNLKRQAMKVGDAIKIRIKPSEAEPEETYEIYRLKSIDNRSAIWESMADEDRTVKMLAPDVL